MIKRERHKGRDLYNSILQTCLGKYKDYPLDDVTLDLLKTDLENQISYVFGNNMYRHYVTLEVDYPTTSTDIPRILIRIPPETRDVIEAYPDKVTRH